MLHLGRIPMTVTDPDDRTCYAGTWSLLAQWACVPVDLTEEEEQQFLEDARASMGSDFAACPLEYVRDRMFGGFLCPDNPNRRHVCYSTGSYSFLAAREGRFWPLDANRRAEIFAEIRTANADQPMPTPGGPFTEGG